MTGVRWPKIRRSRSGLPGMLGFRLSALLGCTRAERKNHSSGRFRHMLPISASRSIHAELSKINKQPRMLASPAQRNLSSVIRRYQPPSCHVPRKRAIVGARHASPLPLKSAAAAPACAGDDEKRVRATREPFSDQLSIGKASRAVVPLPDSKEIVPCRCDAKLRKMSCPSPSAFRWSSLAAMPQPSSATVRMHVFSFL